MRVSARAARQLSPAILLLLHDPPGHPAEAAFARAPLVHGFGVPRVLGGELAVAPQPLGVDAAVRRCGAGSRSPARSRAGSRRSGNRARAPRCRRRRRRCRRPRRRAAARACPACRAASRRPSAGAASGRWSYGGHARRARECRSSPARPSCQQRVDQRRLADAGRSDQRHGLARRRTRARARRTTRASRASRHSTSEARHRARSGFAEIGCRILGEIGLGEHDDRRHAGLRARARGSAPAARR